MLYRLPPISTLFGRIPSFSTHFMHHASLTFPSSINSSQFTNSHLRFSPQTSTAVEYLHVDSLLNIAATSFLPPLAIVFFIEYFEAFKNISSTTRAASNLGQGERNIGFDNIAYQLWKRAPDLVRSKNLRVRCERD